MVSRWLVGMLVWATVCVSAVKEQKLVMEPQDQWAVVGTRIILPCRIVNQAGLVQWTKDAFGLGNLTGYDRYSIASSQQEGDYSLNIYPVTLDDDAIYSCQVGAGPNGEAHVRSREANLTVLVPPAAPQIIQGSHLLTTEGREIELECISAAGKPPSEITWVDGEGNVLREGIETIIDPLSDQKTFTTRSILKMKPKKEHHNSTFTCQAKNMADHTYRSAKLRLEVKYAPKVQVLIIGNGSRLMEGQDVRLICSAEANPPHISYRWFVNNQLILGDPTTELVLKNISQKDHNSVVKCEVQNAVGKSEEKAVLDINYGPRFRTKPYSVQADAGSSVTLSCDVSGNPSPQIVWIHEDSGRQGNVLTFTWEQVVSTSSNLTVTVAQDTAGRYFCQASVPGFPDVRAEATIYMRGPPTIISHRSQYGVPGDNVRLECSAFSIPTPQKVIWSFKGEDVGSDLAYSVSEEQLTEGIRSTLIIKESRLEHFGVYNCTVFNPYGSDEVEIVLKAQKSFPLHSTLIGMMAGVVGIIAITVIYMMCQRKVKKPQETKKDLVKVKQRESDRSSNISDLKLEIEYSGGEESESGSDRSQDIGLPLAGPVPLDQRYSLRFSFPDGNEPLTNIGQNNNGYIPYVNYSKDYSPTPPLPAGVSPVPPPEIEPGLVDPRYSAIYSNPYLCQTVNQQLPPPPGPQPLPQSRNAPKNQLTRMPSSQTNRGTLATHV